MVDERRVHRIELVNVSTGLKHMCNGSELELKKSAGFDLLARRPVLAGGEDAVEAIGKKIHAARRVLMTLNHCATPPFTNSGHATRRTQPNTTASDAGMTRFAMGLWESCADAVDLADHMGGERMQLEGIVSKRRAAPLPLRRVQRLAQGQDDRLAEGEPGAVVAI